MSSAKTFQPGFVPQEALDMIEFCVELNNQDDRTNAENAHDPQKVEANTAHIAAADWELSYDSRAVLARDYVAWRNAQPGSPKRDELEPWHKLWDSLDEKLGALGGSSVPSDIESWVFRDPTLNGFGRYQNAWLLYKGQGRYEGSYVVAVRGTIQDLQSYIDDAIVLSVSSTNFIFNEVNFTPPTEAAIHSGFAHAAFNILLDDRYGLLRQLKAEQVPAGARIYVVGHSQGAAIATLMHSFLLSSVRAAGEAGPGGDFWGLAKMNYAFKSYVYAQPKLGDSKYASAFARLTQTDGASVVVNNDIDIVPEVPLTVQAATDLDVPMSNTIIKVFWELLIQPLELKRRFDAAVEADVQNSNSGWAHYFNWEALHKTSAVSAVGTLNYVNAGQTTLLFGTPVNNGDTFMQHHATTYRQLLYSTYSRPTPSP